MTNEVITYTPAQQQTIQANPSKTLRELALQGPRAVAMYSMARDRQPTAERELELQQMYDIRNMDAYSFIENAGLLQQAQTITVALRDANGNVIIDSTGEVQYEQQLVPVPGSALLNAISTPLTLH
jgi:hypothetical protein